jgi:hypothetical protein
MREYIVIMLKREKFVARAARHSFISYTIGWMLKTLEVNGAEIDASV